MSQTTGIAGMQVNPMASSSNMSPFNHDVLLQSSGSDTDFNANVNAKMQMLLKDTFRTGTAGA